MLIKWGSIVVEGSGKLGGHVFYKGKGDAVIRTLARAKNPQTKYQQTIKARFTKLTQDWSDLTEVQRQSWNNAESSFSRKNRFGDTVFLTGKNLYNALNQQRLIIGSPILLSAPMPAEQGFNILERVIYDISLPFLQLLGKFSSESFYVISATPPLRPGSAIRIDQLRIINVERANIAGDQLRNLVGTGIAYNDRFGPLKLGDLIDVGVYTVNPSGQRSSLSVVRAEIKV